MSASNSKIADNLKRLRDKKGYLWLLRSYRIAEDSYSLEKVARLSDLSLNTIVKIENGVNQNPTIEILTNIAKALEVGVDDIIK